MLDRFSYLLDVLVIKNYNRGKNGIEKDKRKTELTLIMKEVYKTLKESSGHRDGEWRHWTSEPPLIGRRRTKKKC